MQALPAGGAMLSLRCDEAAVRAALLPHAAVASIAALNAPSEVVISGDSAALRTIADQLAKDGIRTTPLRVSHAFHSPLMEPMLDEFERLAGRVEWRAPQVRLISNLTGQPAGPALLGDAGYWRRHVREPVRFADSIASAIKLGASIFLELGPGGTLTALGQRCGGGEGDAAKPLWVSSLRANRAEWPEVIAALAALYVGGAPVDWNGFDRPYRRVRLALPTYPFERRRYWLEAARPGGGASAARGARHPLLGTRLRSPLPSAVFETTLRSSELGAARRPPHPRRDGAAGHRLHRDGARRGPRGARPGRSCRRRSHDSRAARGARRRGAHRAAHPGEGRPGAGGERPGRRRM